MFRRTIRWVTSVSLLATVAAVPACQFDQDGNVVDRPGNVLVRVAAQTRPRVLYLTHTAGFTHDVLPHSEKVLQQLGEAQGWNVVATKDVGLLTASTLKDYAAVVFFVGAMITAVIGTTRSLRSGSTSSIRVRNSSEG